MGKKRRNAMPSFLKDLSRFWGTGERNSKGESLEEFLEGYDPGRYESPACTTDALIFAHPGTPDSSLEDLSILLVKRSNHPCAAGRFRKSAGGPFGYGPAGTGRRDESHGACDGADCHLWELRQRSPFQSDHNGLYGAGERKRSPGKGRR